MVNFSLFYSFLCFFFFFQTWTWFLFAHIFVCCQIGCACFDEYVTGLLVFYFFQSWLLWWMSVFALVFTLLLCFLSLPNSLLSFSFSTWLEVLILIILYACVHWDQIKSCVLFAEIPRSLPCPFYIWSILNSVYLRLWVSFFCFFFCTLINDRYSLICQLRSSFCYDLISFNRIGGSGLDIRSKARVSNVVLYFSWLFYSGWINWLSEYICFWVYEDSARTC